MSSSGYGVYTRLSFMDWCKQWLSRKGISFPITVRVKFTVEAKKMIAICSVPVVLCLESLQVSMIKAVHPFLLFIYSYTTWIVFDFLCFC